VDKIFSIFEELHFIMG